MSIPPTGLGPTIEGNRAGTSQFIPNEMIAPLSPEDELHYLIQSRIDIELHQQKEDYDAGQKEGDDAALEDIKTRISGLV